MNQQELRTKLIENVKIYSIDDRGYYIVWGGITGGTYYLYDSGQISLGVVKGEGTAFWPTEEAAWEYYNNWRQE